MTPIITSYQSNGQNFIWHWRPDQINIVKDRVWCAESNELLDKDEAMTITIFMQMQVLQLHDGDVRIE